MTVDAVFICLLRYKNELDRSQPAGSSSLSSSSSELQPYTTPQKSFSTPAPVAAYRHQGILVCYKTLCLKFMLNAFYGFMLLEFPFLYVVLNLRCLLSKYIHTCQAGAKTNLSDIAASCLPGNLYLSQTCVYLFSIDNRLDELQEKYNQEVEERKRLETELKGLQVKVSKTWLMLCGIFISSW